MIITSNTNEMIPVFIKFKIIMTKTLKTSSIQHFINTEIVLVSGGQMYRHMGYLFSSKGAPHL